MWRDIKEWEEFYEVNSNGEVRNKIKGTLIKGDVNSMGYPRVTLYNKNNIPSKQRFFRHRLVAEHFIENEFNKPQVNHKDGNRMNCNVDNLEWTTQSENEIHSRRSIGNKEYKPYEVTFNNSIKKIYESKSQLAQELGVTTTCVKYWLHNKNKGFEKHNICCINYI